VFRKKHETSLVQEEDIQSDIMRKMMKLYFPMNEEENTGDISFEIKALNCIEFPKNGSLAMDDLSPEAIIELPDNCELY